MDTLDHPLKSLRQRRQLLDIPAARLAARIGVTVTTYNRFERGERRCYLDHAHALASMLGCTVDDLSRDVTVEQEVALIRRRHEKTHAPGTVVETHAQTTPAPTPATSVIEPTHADMLNEWIVEDDEA